MSVMAKMPLTLAQTQAITIGSRFSALLPNTLRSTKTTSALRVKLAIRVLVDLYEKCFSDFSFIDGFLDSLVFLFL